MGRKVVPALERLGFVCVKPKGSQAIGKDSSGAWRPPVAYSETYFAELDDIRGPVQEELPAGPRHRLGRCDCGDVGGVRRSGAGDLQQAALSDGRRSGGSVSSELNGQDLVHAAHDGVLQKVVSAVAALQHRDVLEDGDGVAVPTPGTLRRGLRTVPETALSPSWTAPSIVINWAE